MVYTHTNGVRGGFTLVETLVAVSILLLVILGPMTIAAKGVQSAYYANEQTAAVFLAQEAIESIRKLRDDGALAAIHAGTTNTMDWYTNLPSSCKTATPGCDYDFLTDSFRSCVGNSCNVLQNPSTSGIVYGYSSGWSPSIYTRKIVIGPEESGGVHVTVTVTWNARLFNNTDRTVILQSYVYDQYKQ